MVHLVRVQKVVRPQQRVLVGISEWSRAEPSAADLMLAAPPSVDSLALRWARLKDTAAVAVMACARIVGQRAGSHGTGPDCHPSRSRGGSPHCLNNRTPCRLPARARDALPAKRRTATGCGGVEWGHRVEAYVSSPSVAIDGAVSKGRGCFVDVHADCLRARGRVSWTASMGLVGGAGLGIHRMR